MAKNEIVVASGTQVVSVATVLTNEGVWNRANAMGKALMKTGYLGKGTSEFGATMAVITMAKNNMDPVEFAGAYNVINDKPEMKPNYALGLFKRAGGKYKMNRVDEDVCDMNFIAPDGTEGHFVVTMEKMLETDVPWTHDAAGNRVLKSNWANHPDDMLFARCTGKALRRVWPEHMGGMHLAGEIDADQRTANAPRVVLNKEEIASRIQSMHGKPTTVVGVDDGLPVDGEVVEAEVLPPTEAENAERAQAEDASCAEQVAREEVHPEPTAQDKAEIEYNLCPINGPYYDVPFDKMEPDTLQFLLAPTVAKNHPELTQAHIENVKKAIASIIEQSEVANG